MRVNMVLMLVMTVKMVLLCVMMVKTVLLVLREGVDREDTEFCLSCYGWLYGSDASCRCYYCSDACSGSGKFLLAGRGRVFVWREM